MPSYSARCDKDQTLLFDVPSFKAFNKPAPVIIACRGGCGRSFTIRPLKDGSLAVNPYGRKKNRIPVHFEP